MPHNNVSAVMEFYNKYLEELKVKAARAVQNALRETYADFFAVVEDKVRTIFNDVVQDFYSGYSPIEYNRNESLYEILQIDRDEDSISIGFEPGKMTSFRSGYAGEDGLYDQVFRRGWHGGAGSGEGHPSPGTPYWRAPIPYYNRWGHEAMIATTSPLEDMKLRLADYEQNEMQSDFKKLWSMHVSNIKIDS